MPNLARIRAARSRMMNEQEKLYREIKRQFPPGTETVYTHGKNIIPCTVIYTFDDRLKVRGATGKEYWVDIFHFVNVNR